MALILLCEEDIDPNGSDVRCVRDDQPTKTQMTIGDHLVGWATTLPLVPFWMWTRKGLYRLCIFAEINFKRESTKSTKYMFYLSFLGNICKGMSGSPCQWALPSRRWVLFNFEDEGGGCAHIACSTTEPRMGPKHQQEGLFLATDCLWWILVGDCCYPTICWSEKWFARSSVASFCRDREVMMLCAAN